MSDLNKYVDTQQRYTAPPGGIPLPDRSSQVSLGLELALRASQQTPLPPPEPMIPIVPVAS